MPLVTGGQEAGFAIIELARRARRKIKPVDLVKAYGKLVDTHTTRTASSTLWQKFGAATVDVMVDGCKTLAMLWESAWVEGDGDHTIDPAAIGPISVTRLQGIYEGLKKMSPRITLQKKTAHARSVGLFILRSRCAHRPGSHVATAPCPQGEPRPSNRELIVSLGRQAAGAT